MLLAESSSRPIAASSNHASPQAPNALRDPAAVEDVLTDDAELIGGVALVPKPLPELLDAFGDGLFARRRRAPGPALLLVTLLKGAL